MQKALSIFSLSLVALAAGCVHANGQVPPGPTVYTCPPAVDGGTAYSPINQAAPATGTTYSDVPPAGPGVYCYIVQTWTGTNSSVPSNVAQVTLTAALPQANLAWVDPSNMTGVQGLIVSRTPAIASARPLAPTLGNPTPVASLDKPPSGNLAAKSPMDLTAKPGI